jgi:HK97 family phage major capsid protein
MNEQIRQRVFGQPHFRMDTIKREMVNKEKRTADLSFASENPIERYWGIEILDHSPAFVKLGRWNNKPPLLKNHREMRGVIENGRIENKRLLGTARLSRSPEAEQLLMDMEDEIAVHTSVGYMIHSMDEMKPEEMDEALKQMCLAAGVKAFRCSWEPIEGSSVDIPADITVGLGKRGLEYYDLDDISDVAKVTAAVRSFKPPEQLGVGEEKPQIPQRSITMETPELTPEQKAERQKVEAAKLESERVVEIEAVGTRFADRIGGKEKMDKLVKDAVELKRSAEEFRGDIYMRVTDDKPLESVESFLDLSSGDKKRYSISRAILSLSGNSGEKAEFERECSTEIAKRMGVTPKGLFVPYELQGRDAIPANVRAELASVLKRYGIRDLSVGSATAGGNLVGTDLIASSFIELLRNKALMLKLGVKTLPGLVGNVAIPKWTGASTAYWVDETTAVTESNPTVGQVTMSPNHVGTFIDFTRQLLLQATPAIDALVTEDLIRVLALGIDAAILHGAGTDEPTGIAGTSNVGAVSGAGMGWVGAVEFETDVAEANADVATMSFVARPSVRGTLKTREKALNTGKFVIGDDGLCNGYPFNVTMQANSGYIFFGDFSQVILGEWGVLDINVDRSALATTGGVRTVALKTVDVGVRQPGAFSVSSDFS